jgi:hypothetical protein
MLHWNLPGRYFDDVAVPVELVEFQSSMLSFVFRSEINIHGTNRLFLVFALIQYAVSHPCYIVAKQKLIKHWLAEVDSLEPLGPRLVLSAAVFHLRRALLPLVSSGFCLQFCCGRSRLLESSCC